ncbi:MAG TPA: protein kinase [Thermoanaerobaculia bacterium]|jgi:serine/threonine-protein kinase|nr:protein kinase [Thermoanaerobaculia bacterium]
MDHELVSHFRLHEKIGSGGMGTVYRAVDTRLGREVALKFLAESMSDEPNARERFLREAHAAAALDHPHVCTIYEVGEAEDGRVFMAMAYYQGATLARKLGLGCLPVRDTLDIARQLISGLQKAHSHGVVHRDLKPANVFITQEGVVKLLDFGLARTVGDASLTRSGSVVGTARYMAPEQIVTGETDHRADLWSAGVVLFEMLAGRLPFEGKSDAQLTYSIVHRDPLDLRELRPGLPERLYAVVARCLDKDPDKRFGTAAALLRELDLVAGSLGDPAVAAAADLTCAEPRALTPIVPMSERLTSASRTPTAAPAARPANRRRFVAAAVVVALAASAAAWVAWRAKGASAMAAGPPLHNVAVLPIANLTGRPGLDSVAEGIGAVLVGQLATVPGVHVVARDEISSARQRSPGASTRELANELGADGAIEAQLTGRPSNLHVQLALLDAKSGAVRWSRSVEGSEDRLLALQSELAKQVAADLMGSLGAEQKASLARVTSSEAAYRQFLAAEAELDDVSSRTANETNVDGFLREALRLDPDFALAHVRLAQVLAGRFIDVKDPALLDEARQHAARAHTLAPDLLDAKVIAAQILLAQNEHEKAIAALRTLAAQYPNDERLTFLLATSYADSGKSADAEATLRIALQSRPGYWRNWNFLGKLLLNGGDYEGARDAFRRAASLTRIDYGEPFINLATLELMQGNFRAALAAFQRLPQPISDPEVASNIGTTYFYLGNLEEAERHYRLALRLSPSSAAFHANLGDVYSRQGRADAARHEYAAAADAIMAGTEEHKLSRADDVSRSLYLAKGGRCAEADALAKSLAKVAALSAGQTSTLAKGYAACGARKAALDLLERALDLGYKPEMARGEEEFRPLAADPRFRKLVAAAGPS